MTKQSSIRPARPNDQPRLLEIVWATVMDSDSDREQLLAQPELVEVPAEHLTEETSAVAVMGGVPVGFATVLPRPDGDAELVSLSFSYEGGACEQTGNGSVDLVESGTATVTIPIVSTAEVCTMQVVKVNFAGIVSVPDTITKLDVQVLSPGGDVVAASETDIAPNSPDCLPPEAQAPAPQ